jgi:hypothetical protein
MPDATDANLPVERRPMTSFYGGTANNGSIDGAGRAQRAFGGRSTAVQQPSSSRRSSWMHSIGRAMPPPDSA